MSNTINNGGPAFPIPLHPGQTYTAHALCDGMTLRDYFAAKALQGFAAAEENPGWKSIDQVAETAYEWADAMLRARGEA